MNDLSAKIGATLKKLRHENGWSLSAAEKSTGVSKAMLGQIERGESIPTIATLWKIASGFQTSFSSFIDDPCLEQNSLVHRTGTLQHLHPQDDKIRISPLFPYDKSLSFEVFLIELAPGCEHLSPPHEGGVIEHVAVIEGQMEVFADNAWHRLNKSDGLRFSADQVHGYRNISSNIASFHDMIHYPQQ